MHLKYFYAPLFSKISFRCVFFLSVYSYTGFITEIGMPLIDNDHHPLNAIGEVLHQE